MNSKKMKSSLLTILISLFIILITLLTINVSGANVFEQEEADAEKFFKSNFRGIKGGVCAPVSDRKAERSYACSYVPLPLSYEALRDNKCILCSEHGAALHGRDGNTSSGTTIAIRNTYDGSSIGKNLGQLSRGYSKKVTVTGYNESSVRNAKFEVNGSKHYVVTPTWSSMGTKRAQPDEAYILAETGSAITGEGYVNCEVQNSWWGTGKRAGGLGAGPNCNPSLLQEAKEFKKFLKDIGWRGNYKSNWPVVKYKATWNKKLEPSVSFNTKENAYIIGPFSINYTYKVFNGVTFADIANATLETDSGKKIDKSKWEFMYTSTSGKTDSELKKAHKKYKYPFPKEVFYIKLDYDPSYTDMPAIKFKFRYLNARGSFTRYKGNSANVTITTEGSATRVVEYTTVTETNSDGTIKKDSNGNPITHQEPSKWSKDISVKATASHTSEQVLAHVNYAQRQYFDAYLTIDDDERTNEIYKFIKINKETVTPSGEHIDIDKTYTFNVYVNNVLHETVTLTTVDGIGSASTIKPIKCKPGTPLPSYRVEEVNTDNNTTSNGPWTGTMSSSGGDTVAISAINTIKPYKGNLEIDKKFLNSTPALEEETFKFHVELTGTFSYNGGPMKTYTSLSPFTEKDLGSPNGIMISKENEWKWISQNFEWYNDAPHYEVTEEIEEGADYELVNIHNGSGTLKADATAIATATNAPDDIDSLSGRLQIKKTYIDSDGNQIDGVDFQFQIEITYYDKNGNVRDVYKGDTPTIKSGTTWRSDLYYWEKDEKAPTYKITETKVKGITSTIKNSTGSLIANGVDGSSGIVEVYAENKENHSNKAKLQIIKKLTTKDDKISASDLKKVDTEFGFRVTISGTFTYKNTPYVNGAMVLETTITKDTNWQWTSNDIKWADGAPTPRFTVEEIDIPDKWELVSLTPSSGTLQNGKTSTVQCINEYDNKKINLLMNMGGKVWDDTDRSNGKYADAKENGKIDDGEAGMPNVQVNVYRTGDGTRLNTYMLNGNIYNGCYTTYTDANGNWKVNNISVPAYMKQVDSRKYSKYSYDIEFIYDGQTYEPTTFLEKSNGKADAYINASTSEKDKYLYDSMAIDNPTVRQQFNQSFTEITGQSSMDEKGDTLGLAKGNGTTKDLHYKSEDSVSIFNGNNTRKISTLQTVNSSSNIYKELQMPATTSQAGLTFPFNVNKYDGWHLESWDKSETFLGGITYNFQAVYNYCLSINLGLIEREPTDIALEKDLTQATVVVNNKAITYKFNEALDLSDPDNYELLYKQILVADKQISYNLGLYASDYYYKANAYDGSEAGQKLGDYIRSLGVKDTNLDSTELQIYLKYTIRVRNESESYNVKINSIDDYYDETFTLIDESNVGETKKYIQTMNGKDVSDAVTLAETSKVTYKDKSEGQVKWSKVQDGILGSDGVKYNRIRTTSLKDRTLATGETASIQVTFKVNKQDKTINVDNQDTTIKDVIILGQKHNVAEISNFSSYYSNTSKNKWSTAGQIAGRVDEDSAPNNVNIVNYNEKTYYEDDTDAAPILTIGLYNVDREINGLVWDDAQTDAIEFSQTVGNGSYNPAEGDKLIPNLTTEIYEVISVPTKDNKNVYEEYYFTWPTDKPNEKLGGKTLEQVTGFDQSITTNDEGIYAFSAVPAGNYKVRFVYGNKDIATKNKEDNKGYSEVYNGQDYKSTAYHAGFNESEMNSDGYINNEWQDLTNKSLAEARVSDARDDEARRLYVASKSEILTYDNTSILETADNFSTNHDKLFGKYDKNNPRKNPNEDDGYYMYAETAKINISIEDINKLKAEQIPEGIELGTITGSIKSDGLNVGTKSFKYIVNNIDCGIEERSQTKITLDKQIKEITLTTSDGKVILDAVYDIAYKIEDDGSITATVELNKEKSIGYENIASLNRNGSSQGYRYIMAEGTVLQGTTINIKYQITAFNVGETDRDTPKLQTLWKDVNDKDKASSKEEQTAIIDSALNELSTNLYTDTKDPKKDRRLYNGKELGYGTYFGSVYYTGSKSPVVNNVDKESIVKTEVHQVVDYIDTDVEFSDVDNIAKNQSWLNTTIEYLLKNKLIDPSVVQVINNNGELVIEGGKHVTAATSGYEPNNDGKCSKSGYRYAILNDNDINQIQEYITDSKNNIVTNIDNGEDATEGTNPEFVKFTQPYSVDKDDTLKNSMVTMTLEVSRFYSSETDASDVDNITEVIKFENTVGRRDVRAVAGNTNPFELEIVNGEETPTGVYKVSLKEPDTSATEVITLTPPTGDTSNNAFVIQLVLTILVGTTIVAIGIVFIRNKVVTKK